MKQLKSSQNKRGPKKTKIERVLYFANGVRAMDMRASGMSWSEIANALMLEGENAPNTALKMARDAREKIEEETAQELRQVHHSRYEFMFKSLLPKISAGRERAIEVGAKVLENDAKLMGINADAETQTGNFQPILIQIRPDSNDPEAIRLAKLKSANSKPKLLPPPDSGV